MMDFKSYLLKLYFRLFQPSSQLLLQGMTGIFYVVHIWLKRIKGQACLGKGLATKSDEFLDKLQMVFDPPQPPSFLGKLYCNFLYNGYGCIYARRY